jgi:Dolichyl-phosphate-mannose-protein mannosyltransferase
VRSYGEGDLTLSVDAASIELGAEAQSLPAETGRSESVLRRVPTAVWIGGIVVVSAAVRLAFAAAAPAPWILPDELVYSELARSLADTGHFAVRNDPWSSWSFGPLYPAVLAPLFKAAAPTTTYLLAKVLNCLLFSVAAVPAYFLARRFLSRRSALILAGGAVLVPSAVYTSKLMTEGLAYPLFLVAVLAIVRTVERPTWPRQVGVMAAIAAATLARGQSVVLWPALLLTLAVMAVLELRDAGQLAQLDEWRARLKPYRLTWVITFLVLAAGIVAIETGLLDDVAGGHGKAFAGVPLGSLAASFLYHVAEFDLYLGMLPFAATVLVSTLAFRRGSEEKNLRILCVLTIGVTALLAASAARYLVSVYRDTPDAYPVVFDRYMFYAAPLFFIGFLVWIERGLPRPSGTRTLWVAGISAALPFVLPYADLLTGRTWGVNSSSVGLVPLGVVRSLTGTLFAVYGALVLGGAALAYVFVRSTSGRRLLFVVAANLVFVNLLAQAGNSNVSQRALRIGLGASSDRGWIDEAVGKTARVDVLWSGLHTRGPRGWHPIWQSEFFNASVGRVYDLREPMLYDLPSRSLETVRGALYRADGRRFVAKYVLTDAATPIAGERIAVNEAAGMVLYRVDGPVHLR